MNVPTWRLQKGGSFIPQNKKEKRFGWSRRENPKESERNKNMIRRRRENLGEKERDRERDFSFSFSLFLFLFICFFLFKFFFFLHGAVSVTVYINGVSLSDVTSLGFKTESWAGWRLLIQRLYVGSDRCIASDLLALFCLLAFIFIIIHYYYILFRIIWIIIIKLIG